MHWPSLRAATLSQEVLTASRAWRFRQPSAWLYRTFHPCYSRLHTFSSKRPKNESRIDVEAFKSQEESNIQYWFKKFPWSAEKVKADSQYPFLDEESAANVRRMKEEIDRLNSELRDMRKKLKDGSYLEPAIQTLAADEQDETRRQIRKNANEQEVFSAELQALSQKIEIKLQGNKDKEMYLKKLNKNLREVLAEGGDQMTRTKLWQSYSRCKAFLPGFLPSIPDVTWNILVMISMIAQLRNDPHWAARRITLYEDMRALDKTIDSSQQLLYIEALNHEGHGSTAIAHWKDMRCLVKDDRASLAHYELIGVDLFTSQGSPQKAEEIAFEYMAREPPEESRVLIPILATWLDRGDEVGCKHAWVLYLRMKAQLGSSITMNDYDSVTMAFLNSGKTDLALAVFKDMMLTGQESREDSLELYQKAVGLMDKTPSKNITVEDLNTVALTSLTHLPKQFQNRFFYGKWLKKLISMGETDAAAMVIELMYERGVKPDSKHMNGIIGAWLRSEVRANNEKAEKMAWVMIHERLDFVQGRRGSNVKTVKKAETSLPPWVPFPTHINRGPAIATIETFSLLLHHYVNIRSAHRVEIIRKVLEAAEIPPNTFFMNHLLFHELLSGNLGEVWSKYLEEFAHIAPSIETFEVLWDCEKKHLERIILKQLDEYPGPRLIMREMMSWFLAPARSLREQNQAREDFSKKLYDLIIRCMCLAKDFEGLIIALYAMRDAFEVYPDGETVKIIILDVGRMGVGLSEEEQAEWKPRRHRLKRNPQLKSNVTKVDDLFMMIWQQRSEHLLKEHGTREVDGDDRLLQEEGLFVLATFLRNILQRVTQGLGEDKALSVETNLKKAATAMGVGGINLEDPLVSYKSPAEESKSISMLSSA